MDEDHGEGRAMDSNTTIIGMGPAAVGQQEQGTWEEHVNGDVVSAELEGKANSGPVQGATDEVKETAGASEFSDQADAKSDEGTGSIQDGKVETTNVIPAKGLNLGPLDHQSLPTTTTLFQPSPIPMPTTASRLAEVQFHSPSDILGTPFATDSSRFEYPFPLTSSSAPDFGTSQYMAVSTNSFQTISPGSPFSSSTSASDHLSSASSSPPSIHPPIVSYVSSSASPPPILSDKVVHHPKLKVTAAPIPPNVAKKRHRWSLNLLRRPSVDNGSSDDTLRMTRTPPSMGDGISESPSVPSSPSASTSRKDSLLRKLTRRRSDRHATRSATMPPQ